MYDYLHKGLNFTSDKKVARFSETFSSGAESIIHDENDEFGKRLTKAMIVLTNEICASSKIILTLTELRDLAIRPCSLYFQEKNKITQKVLNYRMRQICFITVIASQQKGIGSVISTTNFHSQRYTFIKHPESFFSKRSKLKEEIRKLHGEINTEAEYVGNLQNQQEYMLELKS